MVNLRKPTLGKHLKTEHFPTDFQAVIFRLWEMVPAKKIAEILNTSEQNIIISAENMGLNKQLHLDKWMERGYISILRAVWNLLPYEQICNLLDCNEEYLSYILKEDDYLGEKLGEKCDCHYVVYRELSDSEMIEYYGTLAASYGGRLTAKYKNAICLVLSENEIFSSMDSSLEIEPFYLVSRPHSKIVSGFPLDALSVQIESGKYFQDLEQNLAVDKKTIEQGFSQFFKGILDKNNL